MWPQINVTKQLACFSLHLLIYFTIHKYQPSNILISLANRIDTRVSSPNDNFSITYRNISELTLENIDHITHNNFVTVRDNLTIQIRLDFVSKKDVKLILRPNATINFKLSNVHFIRILTILEH